MMKRVLVTGAGHGLGFEFARQYVVRGDLVFAGCRNLAQATRLQELAAQHPDGLKIVNLDVRDSLSIEKAWKTVQDQVSGLDVLINNAGMNASSKDAGDSKSHQVLGCLNQENMLAMVHVNAIAPLMITQRFLDVLKAGQEPRVINVSSTRGSITREIRSGSYSYPTSKAALNMLSRVLAFDLAQLGITIVLLDPGWVRTDMGGQKGLLSAEQSVKEMLQVIDNVSVKDAGHFLDRTGVDVPW